MAELVDALVSGTSGATLGSSSLLMPTKSSGVVAQLIERYVRIVEVVGLSPISSTICRIRHMLQKAEKFFNNQSLGIWRNGRR